MRQENLAKAFGNSLLVMENGAMLVDECCPPDEDHPHEPPPKRLGMIEWLLEPLTYGFMQRGLAASVMVGILCAVMGTYVVLRGMAFLGDAMAHAILPGIAIAYILDGSLLIGAIAAAVARRAGHRIYLPRRQPEGRHRHRHPVRGGALAGRGAHQHHADLCGGLEPHPVRQCAGRQCQATCG